MTETKPTISTSSEAIREALKACPFCGGEPLDVMKSAAPALWKISCKNCDAAPSSSFGREAAIKRWNTRASPAPEGDAVASPVRWKRKIKGTAYIYTHPKAFEGRAVVKSINGVWFNGVEFPTVEEAQLAALYTSPVLPSHGREVLEKATALARRLCQLFDSGGESQRSVRARHASAIFQLLSGETTDSREWQKCDADPVAYLEACERAALSAGAEREAGQS